MKEKNYYTRSKTSVRDVIISKAHLLSPKLIFDPETAHGGFLISFVINSSEDTLKKISAAADTLNSERVELWFFKKDQPDQLASAICEKDLSKYLNNKSYTITVNGSSSPYIEHADDPPIYHVNVIFKKIA